MGTRKPPTSTSCSIDSKMQKFNLHIKTDLLPKSIGDDLLIVRKYLHLLLWHGCALDLDCRSHTSSSIVTGSIFRVLTVNASIKKCWN